MQTPLENLAAQRLSNAVEISGFLHRLAAACPHARLETLGWSVHGRPLEALHLAAPGGAGPRLKIMLVGSQHGASEGAGSESLLVLARDVAVGGLRDLLEHLELVLVPNPNPDGRELDQSANARDVNLNRDYVLLSQPEARALAQAVLSAAPDVLLDIHESAAFKRRTLGREGFLTDFEAQFDVANHPAVPAPLLDYGRDVLLPALIARTAARGLPAQRYIKEILSTTQPLTNGALTPRKFRNRVGLQGVLSCLLETRLDPKDGVYPSYRNLAVRVEKQRLCLHAFLEVAIARRAEIRACIAAARATLGAAPLPLYARYVPASGGGTLPVRLRRCDTLEAVTVSFPDHRAIETRHTIAPPAGYALAAHAAPLAEFLARHGIPSRRFGSARRLRVAAQRFAPRAPKTRTLELRAEEEKDMEFAPDALWVGADHALGRLLPLLLEPRANCSAFGYPEYGRLVAPDREFFVYRALDAPES
ncbi:MAG: hypothetical protein HY749_03485 [Gammaproteobacteria bacterium]|nr:hypothetical protein [Gammaproteobacteria bacterium]